MTEPLVDMAMQWIAAGDLTAATNVIEAAERSGVPEHRLLVLRGRVAQRQRDWTTAHDLYQRALSLEPDAIDTWMVLGMVLFEMGLFDMAADAQREAISRNHGIGKLWLKLGACHLMQQRHPEALACYERAVGLSPEDGECHMGLATMCSVLGEDEGALHHYRISRQLNPTIADPEAGEGFTLLRMGRYAEGWPRFEARWRLRTPVSPWEYQGKPLYEGDLEGLRGKRLLLRSEQGFGDSIMFARFVEGVAAVAGTVTIETQSELERLLWPLPARIIVHNRDAVPEFDVQTSLMSLPLLFGTTLETIPPPVKLRADAQRVTGGPRIGLCWAGGPRHEDPMAHAVDIRRSLDEERFAPVVEAAGSGWVSLMREHLRPWYDWADTADVVAGLDLVITVDTAMAHLAGSLGVPTWLLNRFDSCFRWGMVGTTSPWYPSMKIHRQPRLGAWGPVLDAVVVDLREYVSG